MALAPLKILTSMATKDALDGLIADYPAAATPPIAIESVGGVKAAQRVRAGEGLDVIVLAAEVIDGLISEGKVRSGSRHDLASSGVTVCVPAGAPRPTRTLLRLSLFAVTLACAMWWAGTGSWLDFWDAVIWIICFFVIELNIFGLKLPGLRR